jgi:hypothetical protein
MGLKQLFEVNLRMVTKKNEIKADKGLLPFS